MFSFFHRRTKHNETDLHRLGADMHSHLIPGIDDGAPDMDTAVLMIKSMMKLGYHKLITTPHIQGEMYRNTPAVIKAGCQRVIERLAADKIQVDFSAAAEYFVDEHFEEILKSDEPLLTIHGNLVLIEFSFIREPQELKETLFKLQIKGYQPIIAHPERYLYFGAHKSWYDDMKGIECLFQLNILSLCGYYGKGQEELAQYLIRKKYVNLIGTDLHNIRHAQIIKASGTIMDNITKLLDSGALLNPQL